MGEFGDLRESSEVEIPGMLIQMRYRILEKQTHVYINTVTNKGQRVK